MSEPKETIAAGTLVKLPEPSLSKIEVSLTVDECIDLIQKETAEFERQLKKRQIEIVMRLRQKLCVLLPDETIIEIANAMMVIAKLRLCGPESLLRNPQRIELDEYYRIKNELRY
jgi:hypothetical protein